MTVLYSPTSSSASMTFLTGGSGALEEVLSSGACIGIGLGHNRTFHHESINTIIVCGINTVIIFHIMFYDMIER